MTVLEPDINLMIERIIASIKANAEVWGGESSPEDLSKNQEKLTDIIFGVPASEDWSSKTTPFASVSGSDQLVVQDDYLGSVENNEMNSSYQKIRFDIVIVAVMYDSESTERLLHFLHKEVKEALKRNVDLRDLTTGLESSKVCETSRCLTTTALPKIDEGRLILGYTILFEAEVST